MALLYTNVIDITS